MRDHADLEARLMSDSSDGPGRGPKVEDIELMNVICECDEPVASTAEIAEELDISKSAVTLRLHDLRDRGILRSKDAGGALVWWPDFYPLESDDEDPDA
jgi:biotin operon repressor